MSMNINSFPGEIVLAILEALDITGQVSACRVCSLWRKLICESKSIQRSRYTVPQDRKRPGIHEIFGKDDTYNGLEVQVLAEDVVSYRRKDIGRAFPSNNFGKMKDEFEEAAILDNGKAEPYEDVTDSPFLDEPVFSPFFEWPGKRPAAVPKALVPVVTSADFSDDSDEDDEDEDCAAEAEQNSQSDAENDDDDESEAEEGEEENQQRKQSKAFDWGDLGIVPWSVSVNMRESIVPANMNFFWRNDDVMTVRQLVLFIKENFLSRRTVLGEHSRKDPFKISFKIEGAETGYEQLTAIAYSS